LTAEVQRKVCDAISGGNYKMIAAQWAGISIKAFLSWMKRGKEEESGIYHDFRLAVLEAERAAEIRAVALVMKAAEQDPKHAQWWLERKCHRRWCRKDRYQISGTKDGDPIKVQLDTLSDAEVDQRIREREARLSSLAGAEVASNGKA